MTNLTQNNNSKSGNIIENLLLSLIFVVGLLGSCYFFKQVSTHEKKEFEIEHVFETTPEPAEYSFVDLKN